MPFNKHTLLPTTKICIEPGQSILSKSNVFKMFVIVYDDPPSQKPLINQEKYAPVNLPWSEEEFMPLVIFNNAVVVEWLGLKPYWKEDNVSYSVR